MGLTGIRVHNLTGVCGFNRDKSTQFNRICDKSTQVCGDKGTQFNRDKSTGYSICGVCVCFLLTWCGNGVSHHV